MGCYDDIEHADAFVLWGSNMAEMHPMLWTRITDRRLQHPHVRVAVLSTFEHRGHELADLHMIFTPQTDLAILNFIAHHIISTGRVNKDFVVEARQLQARQRRHRLRPAAGGSAARRRRRTRKDADGIEADRPSTQYAKFVSDYTAEKVDEALGRAGAPAGRARRALRRPEGQGDVALDHGLQPAHARHLGEPALSTTSTCSPARSPSRATARSRSPASPRRAAPRARSAPSRTACPPTWW